MATKCVVGAPASPKLGSLTKAALIPLCSMGQWDGSFVSPNDPADVRVEMAYNKVKKLLNSKDYPTHTAGHDIAFLLEEIRDGDRFSYSDHPVFKKAYKKHPALRANMEKLEVELNQADKNLTKTHNYLDELKERHERYKSVGASRDSFTELEAVTDLTKRTYKKALQIAEQVKIDSMIEVARLHVRDSKRKQDQLTSGLKACQLDIEDMNSHYFTDLWQAVFWNKKDTCALGGKPIKSLLFPLSDDWMARRIKFLIDRSEIKTSEGMEREARDCKRMAKELVNPPWRILSRGMARMRALHIEKANKVIESHINGPIVSAYFRDVPTLHKYLRAMVEFDAAVSMYVPLSPEAEDLFLGVEEGCSLMHMIQELQSKEEKKLQLYSQMSDREAQNLLNVHFVTIVKHQGRYKLATVDRNKLDTELCKGSFGEEAALLFLDPRYITPEYFDYAPIAAGHCLTGPWTSGDKPLHGPRDIPPECQALFNERLKGRSQEKLKPLDHHHLMTLEPYAVNAKRCIICVESPLGLTWSEPHKDGYPKSRSRKRGDEEKMCVRHKYRNLSPASRERKIEHRLAMHEASMGQRDESFVPPNDPADARVEVAYDRVKQLLNSKDYPTHTAGQDIAFLLDEVRDGDCFSYSDHPVFIEAYKEYPTLRADMEKIEELLNAVDGDRRMLRGHLDDFEKVAEHFKHHNVYFSQMIEHAMLRRPVKETYDSTIQGAAQAKISFMTEVARLHIEDSKRKQDQLTSGLKACKLDIEDMNSHYFTDLWQAVFWKQKDTCALGGKPIKNVPPFPLSEEWMAQRMQFLMLRTPIRVPEGMQREARDFKRLAKELVNPSWRMSSKNMARMRALHIEKANEAVKNYMGNPVIAAYFEGDPARLEYLRAMIELDAAVSMYLPLSPEAETEDLFLGVEEGCSLMHGIQELQSKEEKKLQLYSQMSDRETQDVLKVHFVTVVRHKGRYKLATVDRNELDTELCKGSFGEEAVLFFLDPRYINPEYYDYAPIETENCLTGPWTPDDKPLRNMRYIPAECQALFNKRLRGRSQEESKPLDHHHLMTLEPYAVNARRCIICVESKLGTTWSEPDKGEYQVFKSKKRGDEEKMCVRHKYRNLSPISRQRNIEHRLALMHEASATPTMMPSSGLNGLR